MAPRSHVEGIAFYDEGLDTDPAAFEFFMKMAWHTKSVDAETGFRPIPDVAMEAIILTRIARGGSL